jgi:hypothetical protein
MSKRDILVVFDIDETLIQFINRNAYHYWQEITPEQKRIIDNHLEYVDLGEEKKQVIFLRPGLKEFLEMSRNTERIKVAIWTYSEREYANAIAKLICDKFGLSPDPFIFKYGAEDIEDDDIPKSLTKIWNDPKFSKKFNKFNTFLVDDRYGNVCHDTNVSNSILVQAFAPFGETKQREPLTHELLEKAIDDNVFYELTNITNNLISDIDGCDDEEIDEAFQTEAVFAPKCMARKKLDSYVKQYADNIQLCTIGEVENASSAFKGGVYRRRYKNKTKHKNKSKRRSSKNQKTYKNKKHGKNTRKYKMKKFTKKQKLNPENY